ncbi:hypothetical protein WA026_020262 [Henosepilachna vigintioctopunctata]|uniref:Right handed beta helix domain-containing protein n=1 Tax=Henosepilachna vigintioctopunctata TaxID=420089 RepID=A0AAW1U0L4_9CUCU
MDQVYNFDKSLQQRLREYKDVLNSFEVLPACNISKTWGFYLELTLDPNGWQAIWKLSRATCETLEIPFPTIVLVFVLSINYSTLQALVRVIAVQDDDIHLPDKHFVPLIHLWPTKIQDKSVALNLYATANVIDMLRFFYTRLFMPWDLEDEDTTDWRTKHLQTRLRLFYDMNNGVIPKVTSNRINYLVTEARRLQSKKDIIQLDFNDEDDFDQNIIETLADINLSLCEIRCEMEILEDPLLRKALIKRQIQNVIEDDSKEDKIWLFHQSSPITNIISFLEKAKQLYPNEKINIQQNFSLTLEYGGSKDTYVLSEGKYEMNTIGALDFGGTLKGIGSCVDTVLVSNKEDIMLDFQHQSVVENLTIDASSSQCAAFVRRGKVTFSNCKIFGDGRSTTHQGIIVLGSGELELINCEILGFHTAIIGNSGSKITMKNTDVHNVNFGLKIYDKSCINAEKCTIRYCKDYAICVETENDSNTNTPTVGGFDVLNVIPEVKTKFISGGNNVKGDVLINYNYPMNAMEDLFSIRDPTISEGPSEEDMLTDEENQEATDDFEKTVVENSRNISPATV